MGYEPATYTVTDRRLAGLPSGAAASVPVHRYSGGEGPTVYVQAAQHGIELNGPAALRRVHEWLVDTDLAGTVVAVPVANPLAFDHRSYVTPPALDARSPNLNRVWPGDPEGSLGERMAARLWELASGADAVIDLHTGTADMLEHVRFGADDPAARDLARAFGTEYLLADPGDDDTNESSTRDGETADDLPLGGFRGKLRRAAARAGVPAITAELANSRQVGHAAVDTGADGVRNVLRALDLHSGEPPAPPDQRVLRTTPEYTLTTVSGLFELRRDLAVGDSVAGGEELGTVYCPSTFERLETVTAADGGVAYSLAREGTVVAGERVAALAAPTEATDRAATSADR